MSHPPRDTPQPRDASPAATGAEACQLVSALLDPAAYPHAAGPVGLIETHLSWVFLAGAFAYKVRKPVRLDFVDFSTLASRRADCEEELRLNRRLAPELYLGVVAITRAEHANAVRVGGCGIPIEYAVRMRRFDQRNLLHAVVAEHRIAHQHIDALAGMLADFHRAVPSADLSTDYGTPQSIRATLDACGQAAAELLPEPGPALALTARLQACAGRLTRAFQSRRRRGHVRECHGDLHLGNVVLVGDTPMPFDCLEFSPALRWIDTINDVAFPFMDLLACARPDLAYRLLNRYLERSGDYAGLALLPFYAAMRALVRARVLLERAHQLDGTAADATAVRVQAQALLGLSLQLVRGESARLVIMHGLSGSGKSTTAAELAEAAGMVCVRSDVERRRTRCDTATLRYAPSEIDRTYRRLRAICKLGLAAGLPMIADATFLAHRHRRWFRDLACRMRVPMTIVHCEADVPTLRGRILSRMREGSDASEAGLPVLEMQLRTQEPFTADELEHVTPAASAVAGASSGTRPALPA